MLKLKILLISGLNRHDNLTGTVSDARQRGGEEWDPRPVPSVSEGKLMTVGKPLQRA